ncbi:BQ5605_C004g02975 [Microbotryum silenes-dioicae]|uniref:BQ5605_C004g02975 protein n=1 Tax=Microbotryum silenes-dioicae TaxID=796604 RepID=A0A2X0PBP0_9BASI|nr:BQ5605_C004g02975 [Microbotryum silenes-dioicae]
MPRPRHWIRSRYGVQTRDDRTCTTGPMRCYEVLETKLPRRSSRKVSPPRESIFTFYRIHWQASGILLRNVWPSLGGTMTTKVETGLTDKVVLLAQRSLKQPCYRIFVGGSETMLTSAKKKPNGIVSTPPSAPKPQTSLRDLNSRQASDIRKHPSRKQKHRPTLDRHRMVYRPYLDSFDPIDFSLLER